MTDQELMNESLSVLLQAVPSGWSTDSTNRFYGVIESLRARLAQPEPEKSLSQRMREAEFTPRDTRLECDGCGKKFSRLMLPTHDCEVAQPEPEDNRDLMKAYRAIHQPQPEPEPVAWRNAAMRIGEELSSVGPDGYYKMSPTEWLDWAMLQEPRGKNSLPQPEQKPVVWVYEQELKEDDGYAICETEPQTDPGWIPLYTAPPRKEWVGLTDEDLSVCDEDGVILARYWETKLREKNA